MKNSPFTKTTHPSEAFYYSWRELLWRYTYNGATHDWRYRYSAAGEREQKRKYPVDTTDLTSSDNNPWVYYLLGGAKEQLAVWHGRENHIESCPTMDAGKVFLYPVEYNTFGGTSSRISTRLDGTSDGLKTYRVADHLGSNRVYIDENLTTTTADYEPFGRAITGGGADMRQSFIDKEKDYENGLGDFGVRKYEVETGRFLSVDPEYEKYLDWSAYSYSEDNPVLMLDDDGRNPRLFQLLQRAKPIVDKVASSVAKGLASASRWLGDRAGKLWNASGRLAKTGSQGLARSPRQALELAKDLAKQEQRSQGGITIAGGSHARKLRVAGNLAEKYGGEVVDWVKKTSTSFKAPDGSRLETHWYENIKTGLRVEFKIKETPPK